MPILIIEGNYRKLEALRNELVSSWGVLNAEIMELPNLTRYAGWRDFLRQLDILVKHYIAQKLPL